MRPQNAEELFRMSSACHSFSVWGQGEAKRWWERHLPDLTGPLVVDHAPSEPVGHAVAAL